MVSLPGIFTCKFNLVMENKYITLKHLMFQQRKYIGLQFYTDKVLLAMVKELPGVAWSEEYNMHYLPNKPENLDAIYKQFRGVAWIN